MLQLELTRSGGVVVSDPSTKDALIRGFYGRQRNGVLELRPEEALYLMDVRNATLGSGAKRLSFNEFASRYWRSPKFMARYFTYRDWRSRGLVAAYADTVRRSKTLAKAGEYPAAKFRLPRAMFTGTFFKNDLVSVLDDNKASKELYEKLWFGQYGSYKAPGIGCMNKLDAYETLFLLDSGALYLRNVTRGRLVAYAAERRREFPSLYAVYADWRRRGYVVKTGFKFGTHFRLYMPGARPGEAGNAEWSHSRHVIQVFDKSSRALISEWARAIRVAHSVRKTFILAIPGASAASRKPIDFALYYRHGGEADTPVGGRPAFAMLSLGEEEYLGGRELAGAIKEAQRLGLGLLLAIADRETAVTYYKVNRVRLRGSANDYFEIEWMQP